MRLLLTVAKNFVPRRSGIAHARAREGARADARRRPPAGTTRGSKTGFPRISMSHQRTICIGGTMFLRQGESTRYNSIHCRGSAAPPIHENTKHKESAHVRKDPTESVTAHPRGRPARPPLPRGTDATSALLGIFTCASFTTNDARKTKHGESGRRRPMASPRAGTHAGTAPSIRQIRLWIGNKLVDGVCDVI